MLQILPSKSLKSVQNTSVTSGSITLLQNWQLHIRTVKGRQKNEQTNKQKYTISEIQYGIFNNLRTTNLFKSCLLIIDLRDIY